MFPKDAFILYIPGDDMKIVKTANGSCIPRHPSLLHTCLELALSLRPEASNSTYKVKVQSEI